MAGNGRLGVGSWRSHLVGEAVWIADDEWNPIHQLAVPLQTQAARRTLQLGESELGAVGKRRAGWADIDEVGHIRHRDETVLIGLQGDI